MAEQFAIAEAKLRAWASMDDDDDEDLDSEDSPTNRQSHTSFSGSTGTQLFSIHFHLIAFMSATSLKKNTPPHLPIPLPHYPSIPRCSDFMLLPQTPPRPVLPQERHASMSSVAARHLPPTTPWAPAAAAACSLVGHFLTTTHIHPRPTRPLYPTTAQAPS